MSKDVEMILKDETAKPHNNLLSFFSKFEFRFPFPFPFPWQEFKPESTVKDHKKAADVVVDEGKQSIDRKPEFARFPKVDLLVSPLEAEADVSGKTSNPAVIWQVYALGGFLVLSWAWARWKERRPQNKSNDDEEDENSDNI